MQDWHLTLKHGQVHCRVSLGGEVLAAFTPRHEGDLWVPIHIRDLGETARGDFLAEYAEFVDSGHQTARYRCQACSTIVKFGQAMQFKEDFEVEFSREDS